MSGRRRLWWAALAVAGAACGRPDGDGLGIGVPVAQPLAPAALRRPIAVAHLRLLPPAAAPEDASEAVVTLSWDAAQPAPAWDGLWLHSQSGAVLALAEALAAGDGAALQPGATSVSLSSPPARRWSMALGAYSQASGGATDVLVVADVALRIQGYLAWGAEPPDAVSAALTAAALADGSIASAQELLCPLAPAGAAGPDLPADLAPPS